MRTVRAAYRCRGGVHPRYEKDRTAGEGIEPMPVPSRLVVSMAQHLGAPSRPVVKRGDKVLKGQPIAEPGGHVSSWVHAPASGSVRSVGSAMTAAGRTAPAVEIECDGADAPAESLAPMNDWASAAPGALVERVARAGVVGMGGAGFPTHVKLSPPAGKAIGTLIVNGAECEPFLTADHRLMVEHPGRILAGAQILRRILAAPRLRVAVEDNKPDAIASIEKAMAGIAGDAELVVLPTEYPQGAEKQLIYSITGREVPSGGLPMDVGCLVENVATCAAVADAVLDGRPLLDRIVTVAGAPVARPGNVRARVGTLFADLVAFRGGFVSSPAKVLAGGPMMGLAQVSPEAAVSKTTSGLLAVPPSDVSSFSSMPCIGCGRCVTACPMGLLPCLLSETLEAENEAAAEDLNVLDCIECGCCAYVCPARRPLVQHLRKGKVRVTALRRRRQAAQPAEAKG